MGKRRREEIASLRKQKDNELNFNKKLEIADKIHNLEMEEKGIKPTDSSIDCVGCGS